MARWRETVTAAAPIAVIGTLACCALPIALVAVGAGSVVASLVSTAPWLVTMSQYKEWVFVFSALFLTVDYWVLYRSRSVVCQPGGVCHVSHPFGRWMRRVFGVSVGLYLVGIVAAYLALPIAKFLGY